MMPVIVSQLTNLLRQRYPQILMTIDEGMTDMHATWVNLEQNQTTAVVLHRPRMSTGLGLYLEPDEDRAYGLGPDETVETAEEALARLITHFEE